MNKNKKWTQDLDDKNWVMGMSTSEYTAAIYLQVKIQFQRKINDRKDMDLTEAEDIKKRWQEYTEELSKKVFMTQITTMVWSPT